MLSLDWTRPSGPLEWVSCVAPVVTRAVVGAGHWAAGRRQRALAAWTSAAGFGLVAWGLGTEAPTPAEVREKWQQNIQRLQREGVLHEPDTTVLAIAAEAPNAVLTAPRVALAVQRRRPRMAAGYALMVAGSVARLRAVSAEPLL